MDPEAPLPTLSVLPAVLAVDPRLAPGEWRTYTYSINLPSMPPPTFRGRAMRFGHELEVGTYRASASAGGAGGVGIGGASASRVMKVPVRVYNTVVVGRPPRPYDLLWPLSHPPLPHVHVRTSSPPLPSPAPKRPGPEPLVKSQEQEGTLADLTDYSRWPLLAFSPPPAPPSPFPPPPQTSPTPEQSA
ncbi:hypothetical protein DXG01_017235 [Tephrocybe rancida]|nr:hypothetical protein DXG01_017235 [Tephrocybe rancida]